jgi:metal-responsive CopG/Arc/MetJ family transcriptional regulator
MPQATVTVGFEPTMLEKVDEWAANHDMSRSEYVRHCVRDHQSNNLDRPNVELFADENVRKAREEGAA